MEAPTPADAMVFMEYYKLWDTPFDNQAWNAVRRLRAEGGFDSYEAFRQAVPDGDPRFGLVDRVFCAFEQAGVLMRNGLLHPALYFEGWAPPEAAWEMAATVIKGIRGDGNPGWCTNFEWLAQRAGQWRASRAEDARAWDRRVSPDEVMVYLGVLDRFETPAYERAWRFFGELAEGCPDYDSFRERCPLWSEPYAQFDRVLCTYETAAVLIRHGGLNEDLFFEQIPRVIDVWAAAAPWVQGLRRDYRAGLFRSVEWLAARMKQWEQEPRAAL